MPGVEPRICEAVGVETALRTQTTRHLRRSRAGPTSSRPPAPLTAARGLVAAGRRTPHLRGCGGRDGSADPNNSAFAEIAGRPHIQTPSGPAHRSTSTWSVAGVEPRICEAVGVETALRTQTTRHLRRSRAGPTSTTPAGPAQRSTTSGPGRVRPRRPRTAHRTCPRAPARRTARWAAGRRRCGSPRCPTSSRRGTRRPAWRGGTPSASSASRRRACRRSRRPTQTGIRSHSPSTSSLVRKNSVSPLTRAA